MLVMIGYIFMFKMVKKMQNSGLEIVAGLTRPLKSLVKTRTLNADTSGLIPKRNRLKFLTLH